MDILKILNNPIRGGGCIKYKYKNKYYTYEELDRISKARVEKMMQEFADCNGYGGVLCPKYFRQEGKAQIRNPEKHFYTCRDNF